MIFEQFWGTSGYLLALLAGVYLVARRIPHRSKFALRTALCVVMIIIYKFSFDEVLRSIPLEPTLRLVVRTLDSFMLYTLSLASVGICFVCDIWGMLFCATAGYCMQHMSQRTYVLMKSLFLPDISPYLSAILLIVITVTYYFVLYYVLIRKADYQGTMLDSRVQVSVSFIAVLITIFLNSYAMRAAAGMQNVISYIILFSIITAILVFYVEFGWLAAKKAELEKDFVSRIAEAERQQYIIEKDITELLNVKCHDLKHQISVLDGKISEGEIAELKNTINIYDSIFKTGNKALDITLTRKSLLCEKKNIKLTCIVDGEKLLFLSEADIYSLFGNLLDNAIEAVDKLTEESKRLISISTTIRGNTILLHAENYLYRAPSFKDGLPLTTKTDTRYHGFGLKSVKRICDKYHGVCQLRAADNIFELDISFPLSN